MFLTVKQQSTQSVMSRAEHSRALQLTRQQAHTPPAT